MDPANVHILLVDDERLSRVVVANLLRKCNYRVTVAESGSEALAALQQQAVGTFQLVLTDVMMPQVGGMDLLRFIRSHKQLGELPVVMMSASERAEMVYECIQGGAEEYLIKPVTRKEVQNIWTHIIRRLGATAQQPRQPPPTHPALPANPVPAPLGEPAEALQPDVLAPNGLPRMPQPQPEGAGALHPERAASLEAGAANGGSDWLGGGEGAKQGGRARRGGKGRLGAPSLAGFPGGPNGAGGPAATIALSAWLARPNRVVQPKESFWIFTETLLLLEKFHAHCTDSVGWLRPSCMALSRTGRVSFTPSSGPSAGTKRAHALVTEAPAAQGCEAPGPEGSARTGPMQGGSGGVGGVDGEAARLAAGQAAGGGAREGGGATAGAPAGARGAGGGADEAGAVVDALYASPEEAEGGGAASRQSDVFSLGMLFFELFHVAPASEGPGGRLRTLQKLRQRILPPAFVKLQPKEAAFTLALLHPDPPARPSVAQLLGSEMFRETAAALQARHAVLEADQAALEAQVLADFLRLMHQRKQDEVQHVNSQMAQLDQDIQQLESHLGCCTSSQPAKRARTMPSRSASFLRLGTSHAPPLQSSDAPHRHLQQQQQQQQQHHLQHQHLLSRLAQPAANGGNSSTLPGDGGPKGGSPTSPTAHSLLTMPSHPSLPSAPAPPAAHDPSEGDSSATAASLWPRIQGCFTQLELEYFKRRAGTLAHDPASLPGAASAPAASQEQQQQQHSQMQIEQVKVEGGGASCSNACAPAADGSAPAPPGCSPPGTGASQALPAHVATFADDLSCFVRYERFEVLACLRPNDSRAAAQQAASSSMVCCAAFDRDDELFATVGVAKRIRIYEISSLVASSANPVLGSCQYPVLEISSRSRLSSVCWSSYIKAHLACSDYEGVVQLWDTNANSELMTFEEHSKRVWSVDYSTIDPTRLVSGSDDGTIKVWSLNQESSVASINCKANVCSVQFNPGLPHLIAAGTANCRAYLYDLRRPDAPLTTIQGHTKAVSYVRFLSPSQLVTASTDNLLRLWDVSAAHAHMSSTGRAAAAHPQHAPPPAPPSVLGPPACTTTFSGHVNERNFVGLSASQDGYLACGSETNEVFCYYKALPMPVVQHHFAARHVGDGAGGSGGASAMEVSSGLTDSYLDSSTAGHFVSSVCWARRSNVLLAANSVGVIKVLSLV